MSRPRLQGRGHPSRPQSRAVTAVPVPAGPTDWAGQVLSRRTVSNTMKLAVAPEETEKEEEEERKHEPAWEERDDSAWVAYVRAQLVEMYPHFMGERTEGVEKEEGKEKKGEGRGKKEKEKEKDDKAREDKGTPAAAETHRWEAEAERDAQRDAFVRAQLAAMYPFFAAPAPGSATQTQATGSPAPAHPPHRPDLAGPGMHALRRFVSGAYPSQWQQRGVSMPMAPPGTANGSLPPPLVPHHTGPAAISIPTPTHTDSATDTGPTEAEYEAYLAQYTAYMTAAAEAQARAQSEYAFGYQWAYGGHDGGPERMVSRVGAPGPATPHNPINVVNHPSEPDLPGSQPEPAELLRALDVVRAFDAAVHGPRADAAIFAEDNLAKLRAQGMVTM